MDEEIEDGGPTSKTTLSGEHGRRSKAKSPEQHRADSPGPSCVSMKSDSSMVFLFVFLFAFVVKKRYRSRLYGVFLMRPPNGPYILFTYIEFQEASQTNIEVPAVGD
ncbi:unnamed protein product [Boreogadus saida]